MIKESKLSEKDSNLFYSLSNEEALQFRFLSVKILRKYSNMNESDKKNYYDSIISKEDKIAIKGITIFLIKLIFSLILVSVIVFFLYYIPPKKLRILSIPIITLRAEPGGVFVVELILTIIGLFISLKFTKNNISHYGIKKPKHILILYYILLILSIALLANSVILFFRYFHARMNSLMSEESVIKGYYFSFLGISIGLLAVISLIREIKNIKFFTCPICNKINTLTQTGINSRSETKEHQHYEFGHYENSTTTFKKQGDLFGPRITARTRTYVPGQTVSDGLYEHTTFFYNYSCSRCKETHKSSIKTYETKI